MGAETQRGSVSASGRYARPLSVLGDDRFSLTVELVGASLQMVDICALLISACEFLGEILRLNVQIIWKEVNV